MKKGILTEILFLKKKTKSIRKKLGCDFIRINPSEENHNADYEIGRIQTFISKFKNEKKRIRRRIKRKIKSLIDKSNHSIKSKCIKWIVKKILPYYKT